MIVISGQSGPAGDDRRLPQTSAERDGGTGRLGVLVGRWHTTGSTIAGTTGPAVEIDAIDTYEWLAGGHALLHRVDARLADQKVEGAEIIGYDPVQLAYRTQYFGSDGPTAYTATLTEEDEGLVRRMHSDDTRFSGTFTDDRGTIVGHWELRASDGSWLPWMNITLTKAS